MKWTKLKDGSCSLTKHYLVMLTLKNKCVQKIKKLCTSETLTMNQGAEGDQHLGATSTTWGCTYYMSSVKPPTT